MLTTLPIDVQQIIYDKLAAADRAKMYMAMPRDVRQSLKRAPVQKDKKLHILCKSITKWKGRLRPTLSHTMKDFLMTCNADDPTVKPLKDLFPGQIGFAKVLSDELLSPVNKLIRALRDNKDIKAENLECLTQAAIQESPDLLDALQRCSLPTFQYLFAQSNVFRDMVQSGYIHGDCYINALMWNGEQGATLIRHIFAEHEVYGVNREAMIRFVHDHAIMRARTWKHCYKNYLEFIPFTWGDLKTIWSRCIEEMLTDALYAVEKHMTMREGELEAIIDTEDELL